MCRTPTGPLGVDAFVCRRCLSVFYALKAHGAPVPISRFGFWALGQSTAQLGVLAAGAVALLTIGALRGFTLWGIVINGTTFVYYMRCLEWQSAIAGTVRIREIREIDPP